MDENTNNTNQPGPVAQETPPQIVTPPAQTPNPAPAPATTPQQVPIVPTMPPQSYNSRPKRGLKIFLIIIGAVIVLIAAFVAFVMFYLSTQLPVMDYDNGQGDKFTVRYYPDTTIEDDYSKIDALGNAQTSADGPALLLSPEKDGFSLAMSIVKLEDQTYSVADTEGLCSEQPFTVSHYNQINPVCAAFPSESGKWLFYFYEFTADDTKYLVTIFENYNAADFLKDEDSTAALNENLDLSKYNDDLDLILGSIVVK